MKYLAGLLGGVALTIVIVFVVWSMQKTPAAPAQTQVSSTPVASDIANSPVASITPTTSPVADNPQNGKISGKLCYPSQFLPVGTIEAKNTLTNTIVSQNFAGSQNGGTSEFFLSVAPGTYILRYKTVPDQTDPNSFWSGYYTDVCPTGLETSCTAANARNNKQVIVTANQAVTGVNLCDFYYDESTDPGF